MPDQHFVGADTFGLCYVDQDGLFSDTAIIGVDVTNEAPVPQEDGLYESNSGDVVSVSISDLLQNDSDLEEPVTPSMFALGSAGSLTINQIGGQLLITPPMPKLGDNPTLYDFTYTVTDSVGAVGTARVTIQVTAPTLRDAWLATINREEAVHKGYRYYTTLNLPVAFTILRNNANLANYEFGSTGSADAVYDASSNTVTVPIGTTTINPGTVIHESVHVVDAMSNWYLPYFPFGSLNDAERLGWAGQHFLTSSSKRLSSLRDFEDANLNTPTPPVGAGQMSGWEHVVVDWADMTDTYFAWGSSAPVGVAGFADFFAKFGITGGLSAVAADYCGQLNGVSLPRAVSPSWMTPAPIINVPAPLW